MVNAPGFPVLGHRGSGQAAGADQVQAQHLDAVLVAQVSHGGGNKGIGSEHGFGIVPGDGQVGHIPDVQDLTEGDGVAAPGHVDAALRHLVEHGGIVAQSAGVVGLYGHGAVGGLADAVAELGQQLGGGVVFGVVAVDLQSHALFLGGAVGRGIAAGRAGSVRLAAAASEGADEHQAAEQQCKCLLHDITSFLVLCRFCAFYR